MSYYCKNNGQKRFDASMCNKALTKCFIEENLNAFATAAFFKDFPIWRYGTNRPRDGLSYFAVRGNSVP